MAKKLIVLVLAACLVFGAVSMAASAETMGLGVYSVLDAASSAYVEDGDAYDGAYTVETTTCAVVLGEGNVIESIRFDMTQNKLGFGAAGVFMAEPVSNVIGGLACYITMRMTIYKKLGHMS